MKPMQGKELEVHVDASFAGNWDPKKTATDHDTARSRHGYIISYGVCPLLWKLQLRTEIPLSSTESEYTGLRYALRDAIPIMELSKELGLQDFRIKSTQANIHCRVFEDNSGAIEMAKLHTYRLRTKHLNVRVHHFRDYVERRGGVSMPAISTHHQPADYFVRGAPTARTLTHSTSMVTLTHPSGARGSVININSHQVTRHLNTWYGSLVLA